MSSFNEELFRELDEILTRWLEKESECFADFLSQTYAWWRHEQIALGLDNGALTPVIMHTDIATIVEVGNRDNDDQTYAIVNLPCIASRASTRKVGRTLKSFTRHA